MYITYTNTLLHISDIGLCLLYAQKMQPLPIVCSLFMSACRCLTLYATMFFWMCWLYKCHAFHYSKCYWWMSNVHTHMTKLWSIVCIYSWQVIHGSEYYWSFLLQNQFNLHVWQHFNYVCMCTVICHKIIAHPSKQYIWDLYGSHVDFYVGPIWATNMGPRLKSATGIGKGPIWAAIWAQHGTYMGEHRATPGGTIMGKPS